MWQPSRAQWAIIWPITLVVVLAWPPDRGRSLGMKAVNSAVDPSGALPVVPPALPMGLDDDGDAVTEHDTQLTAYYQAREQSAMTRVRMDLKNATDPLDTSTQRQLLVGLVVIAALVVWRMDGSRRP